MHNTNSGLTYNCRAEKYMKKRKKTFMIGEETKLVLLMENMEIYYMAIWKSTTRQFGNILA